MSTLPQFGQVQSSSNKLPSAGFSETDFDFDFLTKYLLFDDAEVDSSDKNDGYSNLEFLFNEFESDGKFTANKNSVNGNVGFNNDTANSITVKTEKGIELFVIFVFIAYA